MPLHWWHLFCRSTYIRFQGLYLLAPYKRIMYILGPEIQQGLDKIGSLQQIFGASLHISSTRFHHHFLQYHFRYLQQIFGLNADSLKICYHQKSFAKPIASPPIWFASQFPAQIFADSLNTITFLSLLLETISSWAWFHFHHNFLNKYLLCKKDYLHHHHFLKPSVLWKSKKGFQQQTLPEAQRTQGVESITWVISPAK